MSNFLDKFAAWLFIITINIGMFSTWLSIIAHDIEPLLAHDLPTILGCIIYSLGFGLAAVSASKAMYKVNIKRERK